ncbi:sensor histidine kinase [Arthrobacter celericrescens]|uniref:sensor histidine kinase n=1 Tax=Arthrobacter celericrescens TaxID=2320851 RepID=UPI0013C43830|nr:histidine kinase [Arthrobacter celericrescens]
MGESNSNRQASNRARLSAATRTAVFLMIGGLLAVPYAAVVLWIMQLWRLAAANPLAVPSGLLIGAGLLAVPSTLRVMRTLERTAANELLGTALEEPAGTTRLADVARGALWFLVHLLSGALAVAVLGFALPTLAAIVFAVFGGGGTAGLAPFTGQMLPGVGTVEATWLLTAAGLGALALLIGVASQLQVWAVLLLGPSEQAKLAIAERHARELARRNGLARELHDSIGHALTVTTLQAAAARRLLTTDPDKAAASMAAVEDAGRAALEELDYVLGILRAPADGPAELPDRLRNLVSRHRSPGPPAELRLTGDPAAVPGNVAAELYRMVQEGLSNAAKHAPESACTVALEVNGTAAAGSASLTVANRIPTAARARAGGQPLARTAGGRGLAGLAERAVLLGGTFSARESDGMWQLSAELSWEGGKR